MGSCSPRHWHKKAAELELFSLLTEYQLTVLGPTPQGGGAGSSGENAQPLAFCVVSCRNNVPDEWVGQCSVGETTGAVDSTTEQPQVAGSGDWEAAPEKHSLDQDLVEQ